MIHYHGLKITPATAALYALRAGHAFISYACQDQVGEAVELCQSFALDNGAFSAWRAGNPVADWAGYYAWVEELRHMPGFDFAVIPDVIDGSEADNDALVHAWPWQGAKHKAVGAPVWHLHESLGRLARLADEWPRVCLGSSGEYANPDTPRWWSRMAAAMATVCDDQGRPRCKLHGLRMLDPAVFTRLPLSSADSTNIARAIGVDSKWTGSYRPPTKEVRALLMRERIEAFNAPPIWTAAPVQLGLLGGA